MVRHRQRDRGHGHLERHAIGLDPAQHLVEVEPRGAAAPSRPAEAAASRLSSPRMCDGGVATWNRSSGAEPERLDTSAPWRGRSSGACAARPSGSPVVPELNTSTASSVVARLDAPAAGAAARQGGVECRLVVEIGDAVGAEPLGEHRRRRHRRRRRAPGAVSSTACPTSTAFHAGLSSTAAAPSLLMACTATTNSTRFASHHRHAVAGPTPRAARCCANALLRPSSSRKDQRSSPARTASRSPNRVSGLLEPVVHQGRSHRKHSSRL